MDKNVIEHTRRLLKLADILAAQKNNRKTGTVFDMRTWGRHDSKHKPTATFCGTTACALGHAGMDKEFRRAGLKLKLTPNYIYDDDCRRTGGVESYSGTVVYEPTQACDEHAAAAFFGLTEGESHDIFLATTDKKETVIDKLQRYAHDREEVRG